MTGRMEPKPSQTVSGRRLVEMALLGFASGLPLALTASTMQAWLTVANVDIRKIGLFNQVQIPYTLKFLWSPLVDRYSLLGLGRRRGWMLLSQLALIAAIVCMGMLASAEHLPLVAVAALAVAFFSATQDVAVDAYRTDSLKERERGLGTGVFISGYRVAMLVSGALALIIAASVGWRYTYWLMAGLMMIGVLTTLNAREPDADGQQPRTLRAAVVEPFLDYFSRRGAAAMLVLVLLYKLGDALAGSLSTTFFIRELGFTMQEVGLINKVLGLAATILGAIAGGLWMTRLRLYPALMGFGILQALTNLGFWFLALIGKSYLGMAAVVALENLTGGMGASAVTALLMALCNARYSATQFALLSALAAVGRILIGARSGYMVEAWGWPQFFLVTCAAAIPGLVVLHLWRNRLPMSTLNGSGAA
ncbi:MAG: Protein AmpG [Gammaproteobacteria bacterium]|nr:Protein AmpG [Gammaproteobacteria bacterium]